MTLPYDRKFNQGRQSELLYNEDLHKNYEAIRHIIEEPTVKEGVPDAKVDGALWLNKENNILYSYQKATRKWRPIFSSKFQIVDQITNILPSDNPVLGQLWIKNDTLMYYDGHNWKPVKTLLQDGSQFDMSIFQNHLLISPLNKIGNTIVNDEDIEEYKKKRKAILDGKLDPQNDSEIIGHHEKWKLGHKCDDAETIIKDIQGYSQFLIPNIDSDRIFLDGVLTDKYDSVNKVCVQFAKKDITDHRPSLVHLNAGKLNKITKRIVKVDKLTARIDFKADNFELYGFSSVSPYGKLLLPEVSADDGGYIKTDDGVILSYSQAQDNDFVLIVSFDFGWIKTTGELLHKRILNNSTTYYVDNYISPHNIFVNGFNLEETGYTSDPINKTITIHEDTTKLQVSGFHSVLRDYGFVRNVDLENNALVKTIHKYKEPLFFLNGEAIAAQEGVIDKGNNIYAIPGGKLNMVWGIAELAGDEKDPDFTMSVKNGIGTVPKSLKIRYDKKDVLDTDNLIVFINGMMLTEKDFKRNIPEGFIKVIGIKPGQSYILLKDRYNRIFTDKNLIPAFNVGKFSESLVYMNGHLLCNDTAINETQSKDTVVGYHNEIRFFISYSEDGQLQGSYYIYKIQYDEFFGDQSGWKPLQANVPEDERIVNGIRTVCSSYENSASSVRLNIEHLKKHGIEYNNKKDMIEVFAYKYASYQGKPLRINNIHVNLEANEYTEDNKSFRIRDYFQPEKNLLSVYVNGIRQHKIEEHSDGAGFNLMEPLTQPALISYVIETPTNQTKDYIKQLVLNHKNVLPGTTNVYKTFDLTIPESQERPSLYPGRVVIFVNGIRQPQDAYTIVDNNTIIFNGKSALVGNAYNYPEEIITDENDIPTNFEDGRERVIHHEVSDEILVEIHQDFNKSETTVESKTGKMSFDMHLETLNIPNEILECTDEILIYVDGLFAGLRSNDGSEFTYTKHLQRGSITINSPTVIKKLISDPLYELLEQSPEKKIYYKNSHDGKDYVPKSKRITLEWRNS